MRVLICTSTSPSVFRLVVDDAPAERVRDLHVLHRQRVAADRTTAGGKERANRVLRHALERCAGRCGVLLQPLAKNRVVRFELPHDVPALVRGQYHAERVELALDAVLHGRGIPQGPGG